MTKPLDWYRMRTPHTSIIGLSEARRLPRLGKIRLGVRVPKGKTDQRCNHGKDELCNYCSYPKDTDYFVCPPEVQAVFGEKPKELRVFIPVEDREMFFPQSLRWYKGSRLVCRGDGKSATRVDEKAGTMFTMDCPCEEYGVRCFPRASLMVMLPDVSASGCYQIDTGSTTAMVSLNSSIDYLQNFLLGRIAFIPLILKREAQKVNTPDGKVVTKHLLALEFKGSISDVAKFRVNDAVQQLVSPTPQPALPPAPSEPEAVDITEHEGPGPFPDEVEGMRNPQTPTPERNATPPTPAGNAEAATQDEPGEEVPFPDTDPVDGYVPYQPPPEIERPQQQPPKEPVRNPNAPPEPTNKAEIIAGIARQLSSCTSRQSLQSTWSELVVNNKSLTAMEKVDLQQTFLTTQKRIKK